MLQIRPISDLRNKFTEIEEATKQGNPIFLTKNGYGSMVVMSLEHYSQLTENIEIKLNEADIQAQNPIRLTHDEVFAKAKASIATD